jgi:nucleoside recognition membrane protein YjiH
MRRSTWTRERFITCVIARRARRFVTRDEAGIEDAGFKSLRERYTQWAAVVLGLADKFLPYVCIVRGEARRTFQLELASVSG